MDIPNPAFYVKHVVWALFFTCQLGAAGALFPPALAAADYATESNEKGEQGAQTLHWVAYKGDVAHVRQLVEAGAEVNAQVKNGNTPLHQAAYGGHVDVSVYLIEQGAQVNAKTDKGITPLDWAKRNNHQELMELLIAHGAVPGQGAPASTLSGRTSPARVAMRPAHKPAKSYAPEEVRSPPKASKANGTYRIQLASLSSEQATIYAWATFRHDFPGILKDSELIVDTVDINGKQYYRVQTAASTESEARSMCHQLKSLDQPCLVVSASTP